jgi:RNA polymerase sigma-70 factor (ECF subfamily)
MRVLDQETAANACCWRIFVKQRNTLFCNTATLAAHLALEHRMSDPSALNLPAPPLDFDEVLRETQSHLRAYIAGMGVPRHDVDDLAQDVYVELYRCMNRIPAEVTVKQWLKGIARNLCLNYFRRTARRGRLHREALAEMLIDLTYEAKSNWYEGAVQTALEKCFEKLPKESRKLVKLRYEEEMPSQTMAEQLGSTSEAIRVALFRIRNVLKDCIASRLAAEGA